MKNRQFVDVDGIRTSYFVEGRGEPLVLFHGGHFGANDNVDFGVNWALNWPHLTRSFQVFAPDRLGQGHTDLPRSDDEYTMQAVVRHAYGFLRAMGLEGVHLVGHSRGGYVVTRLALDHPDLVRTLVVVDSNTTSPGENAANDREKSTTRRARLLAEAPKPLHSRESIRWVTEQFSATTEHITDDWLDARVEVAEMPKTKVSVEKMETLSSTVFLPAMAQYKAETLDWLREGRLKTPTLLVWGKNDPSAVLSGGLALFDLVCASVPRAQMHIFNQAGHYSYREHPEEFARIVTGFIEGHPSPSADRLAVAGQVG